jgi:hypothetical protein
MIPVLQSIGLLIVHACQQVIFEAKEVLRREQDGGKKAPLRQV